MQYRYKYYVIGLCNNSSLTENKSILQGHHKILLRRNGLILQQCSVRQTRRFTECWQHQNPHCPPGKIELVAGTLCLKKVSYISIDIHAFHSHHGMGSKLSRKTQALLAQNQLLIG
jgi:hypothetical protein